MCKKSPKKSVTTATRHFLNVEQIIPVVHTNTIVNTINNNKSLSISTNITRNTTCERIDLATLHRFEANRSVQKSKI